MLMGTTLMSIIPMSITLMSKMRWGIVFTGVPSQSVSMIRLSQFRHILRYVPFHALEHTSILVLYPTTFPIYSFLLLITT